MSPTVWMSPASNGARALLAHDHALGAIAIHLDGDFLDVEDDVGHVLAHARRSTRIHAARRRSARRSQPRPAATTAARGAARCRGSGQSRARAARRRAWSASCLFDENSILFGLISSCQFFWIIYAFLPFARHHPIVAGEPGMPRRSALRRSRGVSAMILDAAPLARAAAIVRDRRHVADRGDGEAGRLQRAQRRFTTRTRDRRLRLRGCFMPCSWAFLAASSAAIWAAYGVDLREPLKPLAPADDQEIVLPCASVMVIMVLLKVELTCATPDEMFLRSRRRTRAASLAMVVLSLISTPP